MAPTRYLVTPNAGVGLQACLRWGRALVLVGLVVPLALSFGTPAARSVGGADRPHAKGRVVLSVAAFAHRFGKGRLSRRYARAAAKAKGSATARSVGSAYDSPQRSLASFSQCPPVGADASCGVLITITDNGIQVQSDSTQGPLDGIEDTLIGVQNSSSGTIGSLQLSANTDLFGFDGDGLCAASPRPSGCPFGPTLYEGPGTSFSNINPSSTGGVVNFTNGLAPGASGYFSLEENLSGAKIVTGGPSASEQGADQNAGEAPVNCSNRRPVNCATGTFWHEFEDLRIPGRGAPLDFRRTYVSSSSATNGPLGYGWTHSYNMSLAVDQSSGNVTVTQEDGATVTFSPDGSGGYVAAPRVLASLVKNGDGTYTFTRNADLVHFTFSAAGQLLREVDRNGYTTTLSYSGSQLASVTDPAGRSLTFSYSGTHVASVTGPGPRTESFTYDGSGNLASATDPAGGTWSFTYDASHRLLTMTDPRNGVTTNVYDTSGRVTSQTDPMSRTTTWSYTGNAASPAGGTTTVTDPKGNVTKLSFQNLELLSKQEAFGTSIAATTSYVYDAATLGVTSLTDPNNHTTTASYNASGDPVSITDPLNRTITATYNSLHEPLTVTDRSNVTTTRTYDANGNLQSMSRPLGSSGTRAITYQRADAAHPGDLTGIVDPNGHTTSFTYDSQGDVTSVTDPLGNTTTYTYNALGQRTSMVSPRGNVSGGNPGQFTTTWSYDALGRLTQATDPLGHTSSQAYDSAGNVTSVTDARNNTTTYVYDADDELTKITRSDGTALQYAHDLDGNVTGQTDGANRTTSYVYDALGRVSSATDPLNRTTSFTYDAAGNRKTLVAAGGGTTTYAYDAANQLTSITYSDGTTPNVSYTYTANGLRATMVDGTGTTSYTYDTLNRLTTQTNGAGQVVSYGYDLNGNLISLTYPNAKTVSRTYNYANQLTAVTDWLGHATTFTPDPDGNTVSEAYPNGVTASATFDRTDQVTNIADAGPGGTLASFAYTRDSNGQLTSTTPTGTGQGGNETYGYNSLNKLTALGSATYAYDGADNVTKLANGATLGYDAANEATSYTPAGGSASTLAYDQRGNRLNGLTPTGAPVSYGYDQANRLVSATSSGGAAGAILAGGQYHSLALKSDGTAWAWGYNVDGELGDGTTTNRTAPVQVSGLTGVSAIAAGNLHSLALTSGGVVKSWGSNVYGQLGDGTTTGRKTPVQVTGLTGITAVAGGNYHSLALRADGTVAAWGLNNAGQLGDGTTTSRTVPVSVQGLSGVVAIAAGGLPGFAGHSVALKGDGTVWTWGYGKHGQLGNGSMSSSTTPLKVAGLSGVVAIAAKGDNTYALKGDGTVWAWGDDGYGQLGNTGVQGSQSTVPVQVAISGVAAIAAGGTHALALKSDGTAWGWGNNNTGQLGDGGACGKTCTTPVKISSLSNAAVLAAGYVHSLAALSDGTVKAWGRNAEGELGDGTTTVRLTPVTTSGLGGVKASMSSTYAYDGDGLRASATVSGSTARFAWGLVGPVQLLLTDGATNYVYDDQGLPIEQIDGGGTPLYYQHDQLGSTRLLTNGGGAVAATYTYDPYGTLTSHTGSADTPLRFAGQYQDATGLYYLRARYYDPMTAQFLTRDSLSALTQQTYGYTSGNPLNWVDPAGLCNKNPLSGSFWTHGNCISDGATAAAKGVYNAGSWAWNGVADLGSAAVQWVEGNWATLVTIGAIGACLAPGVGWVTCGIVSTVALAARIGQRIQQQGFQGSLGPNGADLGLSVATFGLLGTPAAVGLGEAPDWLLAAFGVTRTEVESGAVGVYVAKVYLAGPDIAGVLLELIPRC
jgi:RHS repeat-associated protein